MIFWMAYCNAAYVIWRQSTINYLKMVDNIYSQLTLIETTIIWFKWNFSSKPRLIKGQLVGHITHR